MTENSFDIKLLHILNKVQCLTHRFSVGLESWRLSARCKTVCVTLTLISVLKTSVVPFSPKENQTSVKTSRTYRPTADPGDMIVGSGHVGRREAPSTGSQTDEEGVATTPNEVLRL